MASHRRTPSRHSRQSDSDRTTRMERSLLTLSGKRRASTPGQALVIFALMLLVLVGFVALSIDAGYIMAERRQAQSAADAGALAAAKSLFDEHDEGEILTSGTSYGTFNGGSGSTAQTFHPPTQGNYAGDDLYVEVQITKPVTQFFVGAIYTGPWEVSAWAVAGVEREPADYALIALEHDADPGIYQNGNTGAILTGGNASAMSNGSIEGGNNTTFLTPGYIDAHGDISSGNSNPPERIRPNRPYMEDPLEWMSPPPKGPTRTAPNCNSDCTLQPGYYANQNINIKGTATLQPGIYYFDNSDVTLQNTNSWIVGDDVLIYFVDGLWDSKNGNVDLSTAGSWGNSNITDGLVFWYDDCDHLDMQGNGRLHFEGVFYAPCADVTLHGNPSDETIDGQIFVGTLELVGTSDLSLGYKKWVDTFTPKVYLVE